MNKRNFLYDNFFSKIEKFIRLIKKSIHFAWYRHHFLIPPSAMKKYIKSFFIVLKRGNNVSNLYTNQKAYIKWIESNKESIKYKKFKYNPLMSFIVPVYNAPRELLKECRPCKATCVTSSETSRKRTPSPVR